MNMLTVDRPLTTKMKIVSTLSKIGPPAIYKLPLTEVGCDHNIKLRMCDIGEQPFPRMTEKIVIMLGATGSGKTTVINGIANYIYGVKWEDDFRFKVITEDDEGGSNMNSQAFSQTKYITSYTFHHQQGFPFSYTVTLIDSPGFGDTGGINCDEETVKQIKALFERKGQMGIDHLNAIGFVVPAPNARLTHTQQYIIDSILSVFGKDIIENIFIFATFCDNGEPKVLDGLKAANLTYKKVFKFNNSALFSKIIIDNNDEENVYENVDEDIDEDVDENVNVNFDKMFWIIGIKSYRSFFNSLNSTPTKSLQLTRDVLNERARLEISIQGLQKLVKVGSFKLEELRKEADVIKQFETQINNSKDFTYKVNILKFQQVKLPTGVYVTNCLNCNFTCHYNCIYADDKDKDKCSAIKDGECTVCPVHCVWSLHKNMQYKFETYEETVTRTSQDLKDRYLTVTASKSKKEIMLNNLSDEFEYIEQGVFAAIASARNSVNKLNEIAAKANPLSVVDYIDLLIKSEKQAGNPGWKERIEHWQKAKQKAEFQQNVTDLGYDPFEEYRKVAKPGQKKWYKFWL